MSMPNTSLGSSGSHPDGFSTAGFEVDAVQLIARSRDFEEIVDRAHRIATELKIALEDLHRPLDGRADPVDLSFAVGHAGLATETTLHIQALPERLRQFGATFALAGRHYQLSDENAVRLVNQVARQRELADG